MKLRQGNVFTPVCQSFRSQGWGSASVHAGIHPRVDTPLGRHPPGRHPPWVDTPPPLGQTATAADGTHPTGMHSCIYRNTQQHDVKDSQRSDRHFKSFFP